MQIAAQATANRITPAQESSALMLTSACMMETFTTAGKMRQTAAQETIKDIVMQAHGLVQAAEQTPAQELVEQELTAASGGISTVHLEIAAQLIMTVMVLSLVVVPVKA